MRFESTSRLAPIVAALAVLAVGTAAWPYTVDDAYIVARYASRLASGHGYTMNDGPATDGVTGPLGLVPGILASATGLDPVLAAKLVGLLAGALAAGLIVERVRRRAVGSRAVWTACAFLAVSPTLGVWSQAGLETGLAVLAATLTVMAAMRRPSPRGVVLGVTTFALAWLRPEAIPAAFVLVLGAGMRDRRQGLLALGLGLAGLASVAAFRLSMFGSLLPLSLSAKPADLGAGLSYVGRGLLVGLGGVGIVPAAYAARLSRSLRTPAAFVIVYVGCVAVAGGDWMPGSRLLAPVVPAFAWLVGVGVSDLARLPRIGGRGAVLVAALACALPALDVLIEIPLVRAAGETRETTGRELAGYLRAHAHRVALVDVGFLPYVGGFDVVDLAGVTDPSIGLLPGPHVAKEVPFTWLSSRGVDAIVLHSVTEPGVEDGALRTLAGFSVERRLAADEGLRRSFAVTRVVRYSDAYFYVVLLPRADTGVQSAQ
jgi:hypothetical protein